MLLAPLRQSQSQLLRSAGRPTAHLNFGLRRLQTTLSVVKPSASAAREVPTPLLFLSASRWASTAPATKAYASWIEHFSSLGFESLVLDVDPPSLHGDTAASVMAAFENEIASHLRSAFPPVLFARGLATLLAQTYASSHPLTAMHLLDPPISNDYLPDNILPSKLDEFNFEPRFPCLVTWSEAEIERQRKASVPWYDVHRIEHLREDEAGESLERLVFPDDRHALRHAAEWLETDVGLFTPTYPHWFTAGDYKLNDGARKFPLTLDERDLSESFIRGSGPGGQAINKLSTNVALVHTPTGTRITCQQTRSREQNREIARRKMSRALELLVRGTESGESRIERERHKVQKRKANKKKKQLKRQRERTATDTDTAPGAVE